MGLFDRLKDFGDREAVKTSAMKIDIGLQQLEQTIDMPAIKGLSFAIAQEVKTMLIQAAKLTPESTSSLKVPYRGDKIAYSRFLDMIRLESNITTQRGGFPLI